MNHTTLSNLPIEKIYQIPRQRFLVVSPLLVLLMGFIIYDVFNNGFQLTGLSVLAAVFYFLLLFFLYNRNKKNEQKILDLLYQELEVQKYMDYLNYASSKQKRLAKYLSVNQGLAYFFKGQFEEAITAFQTTPALNLTQKLSSDTILLTRSYYNVLSLIHSTSDHDKIKSAIADLETLELRRSKYSVLKENLLKNCYAIYELVNLQQTSSRFSTMVSDKKLLSLMYEYYEAENQKLLGNDEVAKSLFEKLSHENPDLFYVQKAKQFLEENA